MAGIAASRLMSLTVRSSCSAPRRVSKVSASPRSMASCRRASTSAKGGRRGGGRVGGRRPSGDGGEQGEQGSVRGREVGGEQRVKPRAGREQRAPASESGCGWGCGCVLPNTGAGATLESVAMRIASVAA